MTLTTTSTPLDFFSLFFDDSIVQMLVDGTNTFAEKDRAGKLTPNSRWRKWRKVTANEMKGVLAVMLTGFIPMVDELERRGTGYTGTLNNIGTSYPVWLEQSHSKLTRETQGPGGMEKNSFGLEG